LEFNVQISDAKAIESMGSDQKISPVKVAEATTTETADPVQGMLACKWQVWHLLFKLLAVLS
jgi:hypothetical protein